MLDVNLSADAVALAVGDVNGDGALDLAAASPDGGGILILLGSPI
jgi:hypothetical protein